MRDTQGGNWTSDENSPAGLNKPFWAQIIGSAVAGGVTYYSWQMMYAVSPTIDPSGFIQVDDLFAGTTTANPAVEPNGSSVTTGSIVRLQRGYYDTTYDWVYEIVYESNPGANYYGIYTGQVSVGVTAEATVTPTNLGGLPFGALPPTGLGWTQIPLSASTTQTEYSVGIENPDKALWNANANVLTVPTGADGEYEIVLSLDAWGSSLTPTDSSSWTTTSSNTLLLSLILYNPSYIPIGQITSRMDPTYHCTPGGICSHLGMYALKAGNQISLWTCMGGSGLGSVAARVWLRKYSETISGGP